MAVPCTSLGIAAVWFLRRRAKERMNCVMATGLLQAQKEAKEWVDTNYPRVYGPAYLELCEEDMRRFATEEVFEDETKLFELAFQSSSAQQEQMRSLHDHVVQNRPLNCQEVARVTKQLGINQNFTSNAIEGSTLTLSDTQAIVVSGVSVPAKLQDVLAVVDHQRAWEKMISLVTLPRTAALTVDNMLAIHKLVTYNEAHAQSGKFRDCFVRIASGKVLLPHPAEVPRLIAKLLSWLHSTQQHPLDVVVNFHQWFIRIHPFVDGNGRTCRLLCSLLAMQAGYGPLVFGDVSPSSYIGGIRAWEQRSDCSQFGVMVWRDMTHTLQLYANSFTKEKMR